MALTKLSPAVEAKHDRKNAIINGNFDIWQRNTTQTLNGYRSDDRWVSNSNVSTKIHSRQAFTVGQTDVPNSPKYFSRTVVTSVANSGAYVYKRQRVEGVESFAGETITISFWAKADATKNIATKMVQQFGTNGSPSAEQDIDVTTYTVTTSWQKFTTTVDVPSVLGKTLGTDGDDRLAFWIWFDAGSNFDSETNSLGQQSGTFDIAQIQIETGTGATNFVHRSITQELNLCRRYFQKSYAMDDLPGALTGGGYVLEHLTRNKSTVGSGVAFMTEMRDIPAIVLYSSVTGAAGFVDNGVDRVATPNNTNTKKITTIQITGGTTGDRCRYHYTADAEL